MLCRVKVPTLLGMARSMGRVSESNTPLFSRLFPPPPQPDLSTYTYKKPTIPQSPKKSFSQFRPIIPRSLSSNILSVEASKQPAFSSQYDLTVTSISSLTSNRRSPSPVDAPGGENANSEPDDPYYILMNRVGSGFEKEESSANDNSDENDGLRFSSTQLQTLLTLVSC